MPCAASGGSTDAALQRELLGGIPGGGHHAGQTWLSPRRDPSSSGRGRISVGLRALVNIIGSWCVKLTVPVRTPRATSPIKPSRAALHCCNYTQEGDV